MKLKSLLFVFLFFWSGLVIAQGEEPIVVDTIDYLVITAYRGDNTHQAILELTNMGSVPVQLNQFKIGSMGSGITLDYETGKITDDEALWIPVDTLLQPGATFLMATYSKSSEIAWRQFGDGSEKMIQDNVKESADILVTDEYTIGDSIVPEHPLRHVFSEQWGGNGFYLQQMLPNGDSIVVDQVGGTFTLEGGENPNRTAPESYYPVAGAEEGIRGNYLIRKYSVTTGTLDFNSARGVGLDDSEWIPIPIEGGAWRLAPWVIGTHGDFVLNENTLESDEIDVDFANKTLTVPWGVKRGDDIMNYFVKKGGIAWVYEMGGEADSLTHAAQTGDKLHVYVCGNSLGYAVFDIVVKEPAVDANMVVKKTNQGYSPGWVNNDISSGSWGWPRVTTYESGNDTIWGVRGGIPFATRIDSLFKQLDKPSNAEWEIVFASGVAKPDLTHGDKLKVTAQDGSEKEYFISVNPYLRNSDANLTAIQWPDIPEFYKGIFGWMGDTIPGFGPTVYSYNIQVPLLAEGIPALVPTKSDENATIQIKRPVSLSGSAQDRTYNFIVTAEDDSTVNNYSIVLRKELNPINNQPNYADPFISERVRNLGWSSTDFLELCNPGNQLLDLSDYMIVGGGETNPAEIIAITNEDDWLDRYEKYIPGYKWASNEGEWVVEPYLAEKDLSVNSVVQPGDVFTMGWVDHTIDNWPGYPAYYVDVQFNNKETDSYNWINHWGEELETSAFNKWQTNLIYLFKIVNDSIKLGLKPATDPNDFDLIDVVGKADGSIWKLGDQDLSNPFSVLRKPEIHKGNPVIGEALGTSPEDAEYRVVNTDYFADLGYGWGDGLDSRMNLIAADIGVHFFDPPTGYSSTVNSSVYKVSKGYGKDGTLEEILGVTTGTTVTDFFANLIQPDTGQVLTVTSTADGTELGMDALLSLNDTLTVLSADSMNITKYRIDVSADGLSSDAGLTSALFTVSIDVQPTVSAPGEGTLSGFDYQTAVRNVVANVTPAANASMSILGADGNYVSLKKLNFDTIYVDVTVSHEMYIQVVAEDGKTTINYQLQPDAAADAAFVMSDLYAVDQELMIIELVPGGTNVQTFLSNLIPVEGATLKLVDKLGFERTDGVVADDDVLIVTSSDGSVQVEYNLVRLGKEYIVVYLFSDVYSIDQENNVVNGASVVDVSVFHTNISVSEGATVVVVDENGDERTSGNIAITDKVIVTSADGTVEEIYTFGTFTGTETIQVLNQIEFFPNPTSGDLNVMGVEPGQRIRIFNAAGTVVFDKEVRGNIEVLPLQSQPSGLYVTVVSDKVGNVGTFKVIKR
ncbi:MAG: hypothetical protein WD577_11455 [Bacteroidales bacterium]